MLINGKSYAVMQLRNPHPGVMAYCSTCGCDLLGGAGDCTARLGDHTPMCHIVERSRGVREYTVFFKEIKNAN